MAKSGISLSKSFEDFNEIIKIIGYPLRLSGRAVKLHYISSRDEF